MEPYDLTYYYLPVFIGLLYLSAIIVQWRLHTPEAYRIVAVLTALYLLSWINPIWNSAILSMCYELIVFGVAIFFMKTRAGCAIVVMAFLMGFSNGIFSMIDTYPLYRKSPISLLFAIQCVFSIWSGYNPHKIGKNGGGNGDKMQKGSFGLSKMASGH